MAKFRALLVTKDGDRQSIAATELPDADLMEGNVSIAVEHSTVNYKGLEHCRDETKRSEALDQARRYRRDRALPCLAGRRRHYWPSHCGHRLGIVARRLCTSGQRIQPTVSQQVEWNNPPTGMRSRSSLNRATAASVCKTSALMPFLAKTSRVSGQTLSRSQIPLDSTTALAPCSINS
jgi:hypothetical protein